MKIWDDDPVKKANLLKMIFMLVVVTFAFSVIFSHFYQLRKKPLEFEVVDTPELMAKGLSGRDSMPENHGMLFSWRDSAVRCMWAKDMKFDLDVAFLDEKGRMVGLDSMKAGTTTPHCSSVPARFVLEVNKGYFEKIGD